MHSDVAILIDGFFYLFICLFGEGSTGMEEKEALNRSTTITNML